MTQITRHVRTQSVLALWEVGLAMACRSHHIILGGNLHYGKEDHRLYKAADPRR